MPARRRWTAPLADTTAGASSSEPPQRSKELVEDSCPPTVGGDAVGTEVVVIHTSAVDSPTTTTSGQRPATRCGWCEGIAALRPAPAAIEPPLVGDHG